MSIFEYDEERELRLICEDEREMGREEGLKEGRQEGRECVMRLIVQDMLEDHIPDERILEKLKKRFVLSETESKQLLESVRQVAS